MGGEHWWSAAPAAELDYGHTSHGNAAVHLQVDARQLDFLPCAPYNPATCWHLPVLAPDEVKAVVDPVQPLVQLTLAHAPHAWGRAGRGQIQGKGWLEQQAGHSTPFNGSPLQPHPGV